MTASSRATEAAYSEIKALNAQLAQSRERSTSASNVDANAKTADPDAAWTPPTHCNTARCLTVLAVCNFVTPLDTQAPTPLIPLLVTDELGLSVTTVGKIFTVLTCSAMVSFLMILQLAKVFSPRRMLLADFAVRMVSGVAYCLALRERSAWTIPMLYLSRFLYGITLNSFAMPGIWIGARTVPSERPTRVAGMMAMLSLGIILGRVDADRSGILLPSRTPR